MKPIPTIVLLGCGGVLVYDSAASIASRLIGFPYAFAAIGSLAIYVLAGAATARHGSVRAAALVGAAIGVTESTLGWIGSALLGAGQLPSGHYAVARAVTTIALVVALAAVAAAIGARLSGGRAGSVSGAAVSGGTGRPN